MPPEGDLISFDDTPTHHSVQSRPQQGGLTSHALSLGSGELTRSGDLIAFPESPPMPMLSPFQTQSAPIPNGLSFNEPHQQQVNHSQQQSQHHSQIGLPNGIVDPGGGAKPSETTTSRRSLFSRSVPAESSGRSRGAVGPDDSFARSAHSSFVSAPWTRIFEMVLSIHIHFLLVDE